MKLIKKIALRFLNKTEEELVEAIGYAQKARDLAYETRTLLEETVRKRGFDASVAVIAARNERTLKNANEIFEDCNNKLIVVTKWKKLLEN